MAASIPSPETITRVELSNGITVLVYENHSSPAVVMGGYLWAGALSERPEQAGLASLTAGALMRGNERRSFGEINQALESVGAQLGFAAGTHTVSFSGKALAEDLDLLVEIASDSLQRPTFPAKEVTTLRGQVLTSLQRRAHDTRRMAQLTFDALLYPDHAYGRSVQGYDETVSALEQEDLLGYYRSRFSPEGMVIAVVGAVTAAAAVDKIRAAFGSWQSPGVVPNRSIPPAVHLEQRRQQDTPIEGKTQSDIVLGWPGLTRKAPDYMPARVANTVLGVFGMMGRLGDSVRDEQGLAYYVYSSLDAGLGAGPWSAIAGVNPGNVKRAIDGILQEVRRLRDEPVPTEELADSQALMTGSMPLRLETNEGIAGTILDLERHDLGLDYLSRFPDLVRAVTVQKVQEVARRYLDPEVYALAVAGPGVES